MLVVAVYDDLAFVVNLLESQYLNQQRHGHLTIKVMNGSYCEVKSDLFSLITNNIKMTCINGYFIVAVIIIVMTTVYSTVHK